MHKVEKKKEIMPKPLINPVTTVGNVQLPNATRSSRSATVTNTSSVRLDAITAHSSKRSNELTSNVRSPLAKSSTITPQKFTNASSRRSPHTLINETQE